jgi:DNA mismatch endonuclease (patch repair protein)
MDVHTKEQRSKNMSAIRSKNTRIEDRLAKALFSKGYRYRRNDRSVMGKPDIMFKSLKIAIFCDSEYFHGKNWDQEKHRIKTNTEFWHKKIEQNMLRDQKVNAELLKNNWQVLRFWGKDIQKNVDFCIEQIVRVIEERKNDKIL